MKQSLKNLPVHFLKSGEIFFTNQPMILSTVLGSCISVTMFCMKKGLAAMNHAALPKAPAEVVQSLNRTEAYKYVDTSILAMIEEFDKKNVKSKDIDVKLFGGADMFSAINAKKKIGMMNIDIALKTIESEKLHLVAHNYGGNSGCKLYFLTHTGEVFFRWQKNLVDRHDG